LPLAPSGELAAATEAVMSALGAESPVRVGRAAQRLVDEICRSLESRSRLRSLPPAPRVKVLRTRPRTSRSEFHGLYTRFETGESEIRVWMFTAAQKQVVKARTFLRTLLHEICHHVDMTLLDLPSSLHTIGFHARESSLLRALERSGAMIPGGRAIRAPRKPPPVVEARQARVSQPPVAKPVQLDLFAQPERSVRQRPS
jgi:hypothetical protein